MKSFLVLSGFVLASFLPLGCASTSASGSNGKKLSMLKPANQTLKRGDTNKIMITVWRESISADVAVSFKNLPNGVKLIEQDKKMKDSDYVVNYTMFAANDAGLVSGQVVSVTATGPDGLAVTESFEMTVQE